MAGYDGHRNTTPKSSRSSIKTTRPGRELGWASEAGIWIGDGRGAGAGTGSGEGVVGRALASFLGEGVSHEDLQIRV